MISQSTIEQVRERASLIEVVGETVALKRQGSGFAGLCPFHAEKSPSFHVKGDDRFYHCFGCGVSGNVISFVMETRGISFREAVEYLAQRFSVPITFEGGAAPRPDDRELKTQLTRINKLAAKFFLHAYQRAPKDVHQYVHERGVTAESAEYFGLGFAANNRNQLLEFLRGQQVSDELILRSGLVRRSQSGDLYDTFRGRLIFPVLVEGNRVAGFGGRLLSSIVDDRTREQAPKYINSPETPLYEKHKILYGLPYALNDIRAAGEVILVEGYMDVIGLWQVGVRHVVAPCGTALSSNHVKRLKHLVPRVTILFDGDAAGRSAAAKAFPTFLNSGIEAVARFLPDGDDPDTLALRHGQETLGVLQSLPTATLWDCYISSTIQRYGGTDGPALGPALKGRAARELVDTLSSVQNPVEQHELIDHAAMRLGLPPTELAALRKEHAGRPRVELGARSPGAPVATPSPGAVTPNAPGVKGAPELPMQSQSLMELPRIEQELLLCVMALKDKAFERLDQPSGLLNDCHVGTIRFIDELRRILMSGRQVDEQKELVKALLRVLGPDWSQQWRHAHELLAKPDYDLPRHLEQCRNGLLRNKYAKLLEELDSSIRTSLTTEERLGLEQRKLELLREQRKLA
jgi:DNA primase